MGCKIRFDDRSSAQTYIKLMTDGILLAETQGDPTLSEYNAIILDEAHERSLNIDFLLGHLKGLLVPAQGPEVDRHFRHDRYGSVLAAFQQCADYRSVRTACIRSKCSICPWTHDSEERGEISYVDAAVQAAEQILCESSAGDCLDFHARRTGHSRRPAISSKGGMSGEAEIVPLFGRLSSGDQQRVFALSSRRKIIIATNIAETSLTIPGIRYVIDSGLARISRYNPRTRTKRLPIEPVSQSSANQRKGRAGRVQDGVCIRLYSEDGFQRAAAFTQPEIQRANLAEVILRMKAFHLGDIETFPFVHPPAPARHRQRLYSASRTRRAGRTTRAYAPRRGPGASAD